MDIGSAFRNVLGRFTNSGVKKTTNSFGNDFLRYGNRERMSADWVETELPTEDLYKGYSFAVIQKRGNKVASLAKSNLKTWAKPEVVDLFQEKDQIVLHPYLQVIEDSIKFSEKQFWKNISIYLDLAGIYYLGVVRTKMGQSEKLSDVKEFIMLNPYEVRRVINSQGELAGYVERKKDGRYREWPVEMMIEMRELNPFDPDNSAWSMSKAAKDAVFTLQEGGNYTRQSLHGNIDAPGIITTDVILDDESFANFRARVREHRKGEPLFGNGAGAIKWESMQIDLDKAALMDINNMSREELFAVSGTSKTTLGIEQSGTTRETARVQNENFASDTVQPRVEDIIDFLNLDYKKYYPEAYQKTGFYIMVESAVGRDYATDLQATQMRQAQVDLALNLIQAKYTPESAYQYAQGDIELTDLELQDGYDSPEMPTEGEEDGFDSGNGGGFDGGDNPSGSAPEVEVEEEVVENSVEVVSEHVHDNEIECPDCDKKIGEYINELGGLEGDSLETAYNSFLGEIVGIQHDAIEQAINRVDKNAFGIDDISSSEERAGLLERLKNALQKYWWFLVPLFGSRAIKNRDSEFKQAYEFVFNEAMKSKVDGEVANVAQSHLNTIFDDILSASNKAFAGVVENIAADLIISAYREDPSRFADYFKSEPTRRKAKSVIQRTDILEKNRKLYERANRLAEEGYDRRTIVKAIRKEYNTLSKNRAELIAGNETARAFSQSQYEADTQFLNKMGKLSTAYKELYSRSGNPCVYCQKLIDKGPIPFTSNFLDLGQSITVEENGKVHTFTANYEAISSGVVHPRCQCAYRLILDYKKTNSLEKNGNGGGNPNHDPKTGQFTTGSGGGRGKFDALREATNWTKDEVKSVAGYFGNFSNSDAVQDYLRGGDDKELTTGVKASECANALKDKISKTEFPEDITLYRGMMIRNDRLERAAANGFESNVFQSTSLIGNDASAILQEYKRSGKFDTEYYTPVLLKISAKKGQHFAASYIDAEHEIVLPPGSKFNVKKQSSNSSGMQIFEVDYDE